jgi:phosphoribosylformylglycinamidine synthase
MANFRIFVEKQLNYNVEAQQLLLSFNQNLHLNLKTLRVVNLYDVFNLSAEELERAKYVVFAEPTVDILSDKIELVAGNWFAVEPLPGQYDQRADSALQALNLLAINASDLAVTTGKLLIFDQELSSAQLEQIKHYYINPLEMTSKDLGVLQADVQAGNFIDVPIYQHFNEFSSAELINFRREHGLAMSDADLACIQDYFKHTELRDPTETEIKVLDTYWSDHCRHTTFETHLTDIHIKQGAYQDLFNDSLAI